MKQITELTLRNIAAGPYFFLKNISFTFTTHLT